MRRASLPTGELPLRSFLSVYKNSKKPSGTLNHWRFLQAGGDSLKHEVVTAMESVRIIQQLASDAVRSREDKYALQHRVVNGPTSLGPDPKI